MINISQLTINELHVGYEISFEEVITEQMLDQFASLTGDRSTLHMDSGFALHRGFKGRVAHGVFLLGFLSRAVGMYIPGENALVQTMNVRFITPAYVGDTVLIKIHVDQISTAMQAIMLSACIENRNTGAMILRAKMQVGFTTEKEG